MIAIALDSERTNCDRINTRQGVNQRCGTALLKSLPEAVLSLFGIRCFQHHAARIRLHFATFLYLRLSCWRRILRTTTPITRVRTA